MSNKKDLPSEIISALYHSRSLSKRDLHLIVMKYPHPSNGTKSRRFNAALREAQLRNSFVHYNVRTHNWEYTQKNSVREDFFNLMENTAFAALDAADRIAERV